MIHCRETKEAVQYWYGQEDSLYFSKELKASIASLYGLDVANHVERNLDRISDQFRLFKAGHIQSIDAPASDGTPDGEMPELLNRTFLYSGKAYEEFRRGQPKMALALLRASMEMDAKICLEFGISPIVAHYYQSRHNVCRLLAAMGRKRALDRFLSITLKMLASAIPSSDARIVVLLEL